MHHNLIIKNGDATQVEKEILVDGVQFIDKEPVEGSFNPVTSDGVAKAIEEAKEDMQEKIDEVTLDPTAVALGNAHLLDEVTEFAEDAGVLVDSETNGPGFMEADELLELTAQNTLAGNVAPEFVPNSTTTVAGYPYVYAGKLYLAKEAYQGPWNASKFEVMPVSSYIRKFISYFKSIEKTNTAYPSGVESFVSGKELKIVDGFITMVDNATNLCKAIPVTKGDVVKISAYPDTGVNTYSFVSYDGLQVSNSGRVATRTYNTRFVTAEYDGVYLINTSTTGNENDCAYKYDAVKDKVNVDEDTEALFRFSQDNVEGGSIKPIMHSDGYYSASSFTGMPTKASALTFRLRLYKGQKIHIVSTGTDYAQQSAFFFVSDAGVVSDEKTNSAFEADYTAASSGVAYFAIADKSTSSLKIYLVQDSKTIYPKSAYLTINGTDDIEIDNTNKTINLPANCSIRNGNGEGDSYTIWAGSTSFIPPSRSYYGGSRMGYITYQYGRTPVLQLKMYGEKIDTNELIVAAYVADGSLFNDGVPNASLVIQKVWSTNPIKIKAETVIDYPAYVKNSSAVYTAIRNVGVTGNVFKALHVTDMHGDFRSLDGVGYLKSKFNLPSLPVLCTGDSPRYTASEMTADEISALIAKYVQVGAYICIGQHEVGWTTNKSEAYTTTQAFNTWIAPLKDGWGLATLDKCYYYKDFDEQKVRLITLYQYEVPLVDDPNDNTKYKYARGSVWYSQGQIEWLIDTLNSVPTGYKVILMRHQSESYLVNTDDNEFTSLRTSYGLRGGNLVISGTPIEDIIQAYIEKTSIMQTYGVVNRSQYPITDFPELSVSADFSDAEGTFAFHLCGDSHNDCVGKVYGTGKTQRFVMMTSSSATSVDCVVSWATFGDLDYSVIINGFLLYGNDNLLIGRCGQQNSVLGQKRSVANVSTTIT